jgi:hypothetical protein
MDFTEHLPAAFAVLRGGAEGSVQRLYLLLLETPFFSYELRSVEGAWPSCYVAGPMGDGVGRRNIHREIQAA